MSRANSQNPNLDVQVEAFIRSLTAKGGRPLHEIGYDAARKVLSDVQDICVEKGIVDIKDIELDIAEIRPNGTYFAHHCGPIIVEVRSLNKNPDRYAAKNTIATPIMSNVMLLFSFSDMCIIAPRFVSHSGYR